MKKNYKPPVNALQQTLFPPDASWVPPSVLPDLSSAKIIAFDLETRDPNLKAIGPGGVRGDGYVVGIGYATDLGQSGYLPIRHLDGGNLDRALVLRWARNTFNNTNQIKVGANILYDLEWFAAEGVDVNGPLHDIQIIEPLLDENGRANLNHLSKKYLNSPKEEIVLREAAKQFGVDPKSGLWKLHSKYVGAYGEGDAIKTLGVYQKQLPLLAKEDLMEIFELESKITPLLLSMRMTGVRIDMEKAVALNKRLKQRVEEETNRIGRMYGIALNIWSATHLAQICEEDDTPMIVTTAGNPSFTKAFLSESINSTLNTIGELRELQRLQSVFLEEKIIKFAINGRIHAQFHQMKGDESGTRTGRFSSSNPNLQQVPARSELAPLVRALFIPEEGQQWAKHDYSQQEPRLAVHFAQRMHLQGAEAAVRAYEMGKDFYDFIMSKANVSRRQAKDMTLGRMYGMGKRTMAEKLGCSEAAASVILLEFDKAAPFMQQLASIVKETAERRGYIRTIGGRRRHFNLWGPVDEAWKIEGLPEFAARVKWNNQELIRCGCRKGLNSLIQGSAADMTKKAMVDVYEQLGFIPLIQVHDELNYSLEDRGTADKINRILERTYEFRVNMVCDIDYGANWK